MSKAIIAGAAMVALALTGFGCGSDSGGMGGFGGQMLGQMASDLIGSRAQKQAEAQQEQAMAQQQQVQDNQAQQAAAGPQATQSDSPPVELSGTLTAASDGSGWTLTREGTARPIRVDLSRVEALATPMSGKQVTLTGHFDLMGSGKFIADKVTAAGQ